MTGRLPAGVAALGVLAGGAASAQAGPSAQAAPYATDAVAAAGEAAAPRCDPIRVRLEPTGAAPGASGWLELVMAPSPFGVSVDPEGRYAYEVTVGVGRLPPRPGTVFLAWAATPELDRIVKLGRVGPEGPARGRVTFNKFLVFVTAETSAGVERWEGPILLTGTSPSGLMHTMRGHGIFEAHGIGC